jgi:hypothetical protein
MTATLLRNTAWTGGASPGLSRGIDVTGGTILVAFVFSSAINNHSLNIDGTNFTLIRRNTISHDNHGIGIWALANQWDGSKTVTLTGTATRADLMVALFNGALPARHNSYQSSGTSVSINQETGDTNGFIVGFCCSWTTNVVTISANSPLQTITSQRTFYNPDSRGFSGLPAWRNFNGNASVSVAYTSTGSETRVMAASWDALKGMIFQVPPMPIGI